MSKYLKVYVRSGVCNPCSFLYSYHWKNIGKVSLFFFVFFHRIVFAVVAVGFSKQSKKNGFRAVPLLVYACVSCVKIMQNINVYAKNLYTCIRINSTCQVYTGTAWKVKTDYSGLQWGISQENSFFVSSQWSIWFCVFAEMHWLIRKLLCEPNFLCIFCIKNYIGTQGEVYTVKSL